MSDPDVHKSGQFWRFLVLPRSEALPVLNLYFLNKKKIMTWNGYTWPHHFSPTRLILFRQGGEQETVGSRLCQ